MIEIGKCALNGCTRIKNNYCCDYCPDRNKCNTKCEWLDEHYDNAGCKYCYYEWENKND